MRVLWQRKHTGFFLQQEEKNLLRKYDVKNNSVINASMRSHQFLWRMCESYELWIKETNQSEQLLLKIID